ncbi:hypothetical protein GCM10023191_059240 [Actinoallomurus oryzae]|jgi:hypothetical protein|uniref:Uncharacterized protein n=1 Tax=Actinoallomurus oryzae TaxID=502180 RepID=A0ABP8QKU3_9ACTN
MRIHRPRTRYDEKDRAFFFPGFFPGFFADDPFFAEESPRRLPVDGMAVFFAGGLALWDESVFDAGFRDADDGFVVDTT